VPAPARSLLDRLHLEPDGADAWVSRPESGRHLFGGLLLGQSLRAAATSVDGAREAQSLHGTFVYAGDGRQPVHYRVDPIRSGTSFSTRHVEATQGERTVFVATVNFHGPEDGPEYEGLPPAVVPGPEGLAPGRYASDCFDSRDVPVVAGSHTRWAWYHPRLPVPDDPALHAQALAYMSDHGPTRAVRQPHADHPGVERRMSVSLNHSVWFHRPARVEGWLLSELTVVSTHGGRGLAIGTIRAADGSLVASVAQEALLRLPDG
jgi:acyl-CoA thioesterase II